MNLSVDYFYIFGGNDEVKAQVQKRKSSAGYKK